MKTKTITKAGGGFPRLRDLPEKERKPFSKWLFGQTQPWLDNVPDKDQDAYYPWDYQDWKAGRPVTD